MSVIEIAGKTRTYNINGTGRDTYISFDNGGNTARYTPVKVEKPGKLMSPRSNFRLGGLGSPGRKIHYNVDGTGRDSYIHDNDGGFSYRYGRLNSKDTYVASLRGFSQNAQSFNRTFHNVTSSRDRHSPRRDFY